MMELCKVSGIEGVDWKFAGPLLGRLYVSYIEPIQRSYDAQSLNARDFNSQHLKVRFTFWVIKETADLSPWSHMGE